MINLKPFQAASKLQQALPDSTYLESSEADYVERLTSLDAALARCSG